MYTPLKKTKMTCTIGPATWDVGNLEKLIKAGMNVARLNFSHGDYRSFAEIIKSIRKLSVDLDTPVAILEDLQGPKIRVGVLPEGQMTLEKGQEVILTPSHKASLFENEIPIQFDFTPYVKKGDPIFLDDAYMKLEVTKKKDHQLVAEVVNGGTLKSNKGINIPDTYLPEVSLTEKDREDLLFGIEHGIDFIGLSFVQTVEDIEICRRILARHKSQAKIIAKIERKAAVENLEAITESVDAVMLARGDLAIEAGLTEVPLVQKRITKLCRDYQKPLIIATQILESMINNPRPTRAEVNDAATAVFDQVDSLMLSAESASGAFPIEAATTMTTISKRIDDETNSKNTVSYTEVFHQVKQTQAIAMAAYILAEKIDADAIIVGTATGNSARALSSYRPGIPIFAVTDNEHVYNQLALNWGVRSIKMRAVKNTEEFIRKAIQDIVEMGLLKKGNRVVIASGTHTGIPGGTNLIKVATI